MTEVFTRAGHRSSYPSHRHDEDDFPRITYLEEIYYHRPDPTIWSRQVNLSDALEFRRRAMNRALW
ncbi:MULTISPECIES: 5-deoxy-glucuronate isomerase [unclassified Labrenzia]|uniref:5-deoxy-glucuronate isomerase n=1 Tax=unclassified Labrenzia TaxID=2648686 RepID=UPI00336BE367